MAFTQTIAFTGRGDMIVITAKRIPRIRTEGIANYVENCGRARFDLKSSSYCTLRLGLIASTKTNTDNVSTLPIVSNFLIY